MIKNIIDLLQVVSGGSENIRIAQGLNSLPKDFKDVITKVKNNIKWQ
tara:strand:- start:654 stop:794 length:141 start_codon:yes stop_codon:yes gene_type:complete